MKRKLAMKVCSLTLAGAMAFSSIPAAEVSATELGTEENTTPTETNKEGDDSSTANSEKSNSTESNSSESDETKNKDSGEKDAEVNSKENKDTDEGIKKSNEEEPKLPKDENEAKEVKESTIQAEDGEEVKDFVSTEGIAPAFQVMDINRMVADKKLLISKDSGIKAVYNKTAEGLLVSGKKEDLAATEFTFANEFDFSSGVIGRIELDAMSVRANSLEMQIFLDGNAKPVATVELVKQKRAKKWYTKALTKSVYDSKITGKHKVSFKIVQKDSEKTAEFVLRKMTFVKSTVPVMYFNIDESQGTITAMNNDSEHDTECYGSVKIEVPDGYKSEYGDKEIKTETYELDYIRGRGNSTWSTSKKPYKIKLNKKENLFNMGKNKHWVLIADYYDPSHIRNKMTYWAGKQIGLDYTPECVYTDVIMNGEYYGSYMLCEQIRLDANRVDLNNLEDQFKSDDPKKDENITGGYLLGMEPYGDETDLSFTTRRGNSFVIESPSFEEFETEQDYAPFLSYISDYAQRTEDAIYNKNFTNDKGEKVEDLLDFDSASKYWWVQELSCNGDGFGSPSSYMYKEKDNKLCYGPIWDFDYVAWGNNNFKFYENEFENDTFDTWYSGNGWFAKNRHWYEGLFKNKGYADKVIEQWPKVKEAFTEASKDGGMIDKFADEITYSMYYNNKVYGNNYSDDFEQYTFQDSVAQLKKWVSNRTNWVDKNVKQLQVRDYTVKYYDGTKLVATKTVKSDSEAEYPSLPKKKGYVFAGWQIMVRNSETNTAELMDVDAEYRINSNEQFFAKWIKESSIKPITNVILSKNEFTTAYYDTKEDKFYDENDNIFYINYFVVGDDYQNALKWKVSNDKIVKSLGGGKFITTGTGDVTITVYSQSNPKIKATCKVHVMSKNDWWDYEPDAPSDFKLNKKSIVMTVGENQVVSASGIPSSEGLSMRWILKNNDTIAYCNEVGNNAVIEGIKPGKAQIIALGYMGEDGGLIDARIIDVTIKAKPLAVKDTVKKSGIKYTVTKTSKSGGELKVVGLSDTSKTKVTIPDSVTIDKKTYKVTAIADKAFKSKTKIVTVIIGKYVTSIGKSAFEGTKNLKSLTINTNSLTDKKVGKNAFKGINSKVTIVIPKSCKKTYNKILVNKGVSKKATFKTK